MERVASLRPFPLPGGEAAVRRPNRVALVLLAEALGSEAVLRDGGLLPRLGLSEPIARALLGMAERGLNTPWTSSVGRLFDAAAALILGVREVSFEGEAAALLEAAADESERGAYPLPGGDWRPLVRALLVEVKSGVDPAKCAARFHNALAGWAAEVAGHCPLTDVVLSGGCFVNRLLSERVAEVLGRLGRSVHRHSRIPPNDGGLAVGQLAVALARHVPAG
jgi:hydrogenase maturation protein HypF